MARGALSRSLVHDMICYGFSGLSSFFKTRLKLVFKNARNAGLENTAEIQNFSGRKCPSGTPRVFSTRVFGIYMLASSYSPPPPATAKVRNLAAALLKINKNFLYLSKWSWINFWKLSLWNPELNNRMWCHILLKYS